MKLLSKTWFLVLAYLLVFCVAGICSFSTLAYLNYEITDNDTVNDSISVKTFSEELNITYTDTSNVCFVNAYTGQKITKYFSIKNNGNFIAYYDINLVNVVNDFANKSDLVYTLDSDGNGAYRLETIVPSVDGAIASNIAIKSGETHNYVFTVTFLQTDEDQSDNMSKTFNSNIMISSSSLFNSGRSRYYANAIGSQIANLDALRVTSEEYSNYENGIYYTNNAINGSTVYFFRGDSNLYNNVQIGNSCYLIVRTLENGNVKLIYNGEFDGSCSGNINYIKDSSYFNSLSNYNAYVGYKYGSASSNNKKSEHKNDNFSNAKIVLDKWYNENINSSIIDTNATYCNKRSTNSFKYRGVTYGNDGYGDKVTAYDSFYNIVNENINYDCDSSDLFGFDEDDGRAVGLLTAEEAVYGGIDSGKSYLNSNVEYFTMSPAYFKNVAYIYGVNSNRLSYINVSLNAYFRPVISVYGSTSIIDGNGSKDHPFKLDDKIIGGE